jgi:hypothetical protein
MSQYAQYASTVNNAMAVISSANTNRDGTGSIVDVITGATNGTRIDDLSIVATGTTTSGIVRLFISDGTNTRLWKEISVTANTPSATNSVWTYNLVDLALVLKNNWKLRASTHNAETFNVLVVRAGDF